MNYKELTTKGTKNTKKELEKIVDATPLQTKNRGKSNRVIEQQRLESRLKSRLESNLAARGNISITPCLT